MLELVSVGRSGPRFQRGLIIAAITREVMASYAIDPTRAFIAGMSACAAMAVKLAVTHPNLYAAAGIHSGLAFGVADEAFRRCPR
jgi:poly(3-hydroxybutyrate) depolymerase